MDKRSKIALYAIGAVIFLMMIAEVTKPKAINWRDSYSAADKIPLGCYVLFNELKTNSKDDILVSTQSIYEYLKKTDSTKKTALLFINDYINFDDQESKSLLNYVEKGNSVLISATDFYGNVIDTLKLRTKNEASHLYKKNAKNKFTNPSLKQNSTIFSDVIENSYLASIDTLKSTVLGTLIIEDETESSENINFVKVPFGEQNGYFYIHTNPFAFSNYHLLNTSEKYTATVLSYLPKHQLIWDNYYKSGRKIVSSPIRYILSNGALKWAFYLSTFSLILFVLFKGKRSQRIIPVIEPLKNTTVEFTRTISDLYYQHQDFSNIIQKKIHYFMADIRSFYYLNTNELHQEFIKKLSLKSNNSLEDTTSIIDYIIHLKSKTYHSESDLVDLNKRIETFTKNKK